MAFLFGSFLNRMDFLEIEVKNEPFMLQALKTSISFDEGVVCFYTNKAGQQRLHMNNDSDATIVVHFIVKTWINQEFHAMNKTFSLTSHCTKTIPKNMHVSNSNCFNHSVIKRE